MLILNTHKFKQFVQTQYVACMHYFHAYVCKTKAVIIFSNSHEWLFKIIIQTLCKNKKIERKKPVRCFFVFLVFFFYVLEILGNCEYHRYLPFRRTKWRHNVWAHSAPFVLWVDMLWFGLYQWTVVALCCVRAIAKHSMENRYCIEGEWGKQKDKEYTKFIYAWIR